METPHPQYYLGVITKILDPDKYEVEITIPGVTKDAKAYPYRDTVDEPKPEDLVLVLGLDPVWSSVWLYQKLKENDFIGFRSRGKKIQITKDEIEIGIFPDLNEKDQTSPPYNEDKPPTCTSYVKIDKSGNITIKMESDAKIDIQGSADIKVGTKATVNCPDVQITGGKLTTTNGGVCSPNGMGGFCGIPVCPVTGASHVGNSITGT